MFKRSIIMPLVVALAGVGLGAWALVTPAPGAAQSLQPLTITKIAADGEHFSPGDHAYYQIEICNPNGSSVDVDYVLDTLPSGFSYVIESNFTNGWVSFDPDRDGQTLSWFLDGEPVGAGQCETINFSVTISDSEPFGMYCNQASVQSDTGTSSTGPTAPMQVLGEGGTQLTPVCPGGRVRTATPTVTETAPPTATEIPATETPVPPTATSPSGGSGGVVTAPDTGSGPSAGGPSTLLLAIAVAMVAGGMGAAVLGVKRR